MKLQLLLSLFFLKNISIFSTKIIKNGNYPACRNCVHFSPFNYDDFTSSLSKCEKFGTKNILTDKITYEFADLCRDDDNKCGTEGKYFEKEKLIELKIVKHKVIQTSPYFLIFIFWCAYLYGNIILMSDKL